MPEVAHLVLLAQQLLQPGRVGCLGRVLVSHAVGNTVADAGNLDFLLCHGKQWQYKQKHQKSLSHYFQVLIVTLLIVTVICASLFFLLLLYALLHVCGNCEKGITA